MLSNVCGTRIVLEIKRFCKPGELVLVRPSYRRLGQSRPSVIVSKDGETVIKWLAGKLREFRHHAHGNDIKLGWSLGYTPKEVEAVLDAASDWNTHRAAWLRQLRVELLEACKLTEVEVA